jgi:CRP-like cAMP-binding protein
VQRPVTHSLVQALRVVPAFASLDDASLLRIVGASANLFWPAGSRVFEEGTPGEALYVVLSGEVGVFAADGAEIARIEPGDFFGEFSLLTASSHTRTARALADSELLVLPKDSFEELLESHPDLDAHVRRKVEERTPAARPTLS